MKLYKNSVTLCTKCSEVGLSTRSSLLYDQARRSLKEWNIVFRTPRYLIYYLNITRYTGPRDFKVLTHKRTCCRDVQGTITITTCTDTSKCSRDMSKVPSCVPILSNSRKGILWEVRSCDKPNELQLVELHETCRREKIFQGRHSFI